VFVVLQGAGNDTSARRRVLRLGSLQTSFATWLRTHDVRPGDLFGNEEWPEGTTKDLYLYIVFTKGDSTQAGLGAGVIVDDVFLGRRAVETLAEFVYDVDVCASEEGSENCLDGTEPSNRYLGRLSRVFSYQSNRSVDRRDFAYLGLNGRISGVLDQIGWRGFGADDAFISRYHYNGRGFLDTLTAPYALGDTHPRIYDYFFEREYPDGVKARGGPTFLDPDRDPPSHEYGPDRRWTRRRYLNGTTEERQSDQGGRIEQIKLWGPDGLGGSQEIWDSGVYGYDPAGNIDSIGNQKFAYDGAGRLVRATVQRRPHFSPNPDPNTYGTSFGYDLAGNMTSRTWAETPGSNPPPAGYPFTRSFGTTLSANTNQAQGADFRYDVGGRMVRLPGADGVASGASWDPSGRMTGWYRGWPETQGNLVESFVYDAGGNRIVRYRALGDGRSMLYLRDPSGTLLSTYETDPADGVQFMRDYVMEGGEPVVERTADRHSPQAHPNTPMSSGGDYGFTLNASYGYASYLADIRTASGHVRQVTGIVPDANRVFHIPESEFAAGEPNYVRIRGEG